MQILTLNTGSSSLKFALYEIRNGHSTEAGVSDLSCERVRYGSIQGIGSAQGSVRVSNRDGDERTIELQTADREAALRWLMAELDREGIWNELTAVGHRFVHGGLAFRQPVLITREVRDAIEELVPLAPAHLPGELAAFEMIARASPSLPQVACFDTAFHADLPREARLFGIPHRLAEAGVVRYGFHGLSYEYVTTALSERGQLGARTVVAHLGNGASMAAIANGKCVDTSMGFTPAGGFVMSTRSGDIDPGVLLYLLEERKMSVEEVDSIVRSAGGLLGLSGTASDMRDLLARAGTDGRAADAVAVFCYQIRKFLGAYIAVLCGLDTLVFTGGIGENAAEIRARVCASLGCFGVEIDAEANAAGEPIISRDGAPVTVHVIRTDEESVIARDTLRVLRESAGADND